MSSKSLEGVWKVTETCLKVVRMVSEYMFVHKFFQTQDLFKHIFFGNKTYFDTKFVLDPIFLSQFT